MSRAAAAPAALPKLHWTDRLLAIAGDAAPGEAAGRLRVLRRLVLCWGAVRSVVWLGAGAPVDPAWLAASAALLAACAALAFAPRLEHLGPRLALPALAVQLALTFPLTNNHWFLELFAVGLLAFAGRDGRDAPLVLQALRWLTAIVLLHTGLQKLLYGQYFGGEFLAFMVGRGDRFADLFQWLLPAQEVARLQAYQPMHEGAGPYRVAQPLFVAVSNAVWLAELALPVGLLWRRTRTLAAAAAIAFVLALQLGARELGFALLFTGLLLLFAPAAWARRALPVQLVVLALALALTAVAPGQTLLEEWHLW
jgi:hypothetical protein